MSATGRELVQVGDTVRVGKGKTIWLVEGFIWFNNGKRYAALCSTTGYANSTATPDRLTIITKGNNR